MKKELTRICWNEIKGKIRRGKTLEGWEGERKTFYEDKGWRTEEVECLREGEVEIMGRRVTLDECQAGVTWVLTFGTSSVLKFLVGARPTLLRVSSAWASTYT